jgi:hypothetical protein
VTGTKHGPAEAETERTRPRSFTGVVFGVEGRIASSVYGTVLVMATLTAASGQASHPWRLAVLVSSTVFAVWIAHLYAHGLSESIELGRRVSRGDLGRIAHRELGILFAAALPTAVLVLGAVGLLRERTAIWVALSVGLVVLAVEGVRYARVEGLSRAGTVASVAANLTLGLLVVGMKALVFH